MAATLELKNVSFSFASQSKPFFQNLSVTFPAGELHVMRGQNGAGKSTLFNLLRGLIHPQEQIDGSIIFDNATITLSGNNSNSLIFLQKSIKLVQQNFDLMLADQLTFEENLRAAQFDQHPLLIGLPKLKALPQFIERFGIQYQKPVHLLSGGQRQALAILMALQKPTKVLLLDEPTAALDAYNSKMIMDFLQALVTENGLTILIISHDLELVQKYAQNHYYQFNIHNDGTRSVERVTT